MSISIPDFDQWLQGYNGATVTVYRANTTTLAALFSDEACTIPIANPQTLQSTTIGDELYGRWQQPVYVNEAYYLSIDTSEQTGVVRLPVYTAVGLDVSKSVVQPTVGSISSELEDHLSRIIYVANFGALDPAPGSAATNNAIIAAAIGAAAAQGGGDVICPSGTYPFQTLSLPAGVHLIGQGSSVTILQSQEAADVITIAGAAAGLGKICIDGVAKLGNSVGVKAKAQMSAYMCDALIKRFETGIYLHGGSFHQWNQLSVSDCSVGLKAYGDTSSSGSDLRNCVWQGGKVDLCTSFGIEIKFVDATVDYFRFEDVKIYDNLGVAVRVEGCRHTTFEGCHFKNNTGFGSFVDKSPVTVFNTLIGLNFEDCYIEDGTCLFQDTCDNVQFRNCELKDIDINFVTLKNAIKLVNCTEDSEVTFAGDATKLVRQFDEDSGSTKGVTTGNAATKALSVKLDHGEMCAGWYAVTGKQRNGADKATYAGFFSAQRAPAQLLYDAQTANFTVGNIVTGATSGATGRIVVDVDGGATGTLSLTTVTGVFIDNEVITDTGGGSALANGTLVAGSVTILAQQQPLISETDATWAATWVGTVEEAELQVTGATSKTVDWTCRADYLRNG